jgi:rhodanese-related sulfurtransferase
MARAFLNIPRMAAAEALTRFRSGEPIVFVDARREVEWRNAVERLPGAVRLAPEGTDETLPIIKRSHTAIVYCTCPLEGSSEVAAEHLLAHGCENVYVLYGGLQAWQLAQGPVEPGRAARRAMAPRVDALRPAASRR